MIIVPRSIVKSPNALFNAFLIHQPNFWFMTPSLFSRFSLFQQKTLINTFQGDLLFGGEPFPLHVLSMRTLKKNLNEQRLWNIYGTTECSVWATLFLIPPEWKQNEIPIGDPLDGISLSIHNEELQIQCGEGCWVGHELERPLIRSTGDLVYEENLCIYWKGRKDSVVKRFGQRFSLSEIEYVLPQACT